ncbi:hypothetical protein BgiBS90_008080 [Biomphalaria glabrata]|nr:hypothetical protein BgiBS90_008080 [Biomphalaria glabrata]
MVGWDRKTFELSAVMAMEGAASTPKKKDAGFNWELILAQLRNKLPDTLGDNTTICVRGGLSAVGIFQKALTLVEIGENQLTRDTWSLMVKQVHQHSNVSQSTSTSKMSHKVHNIQMSHKVHNIQNDAQTSPTSKCPTDITNIQMSHRHHQHPNVPQTSPTSKCPTEYINILRYRACKGPGQCTVVIKTVTFTNTNKRSRYLYSTS